MNRRNEHIKTKINHHKARLKEQIFLALLTYIPLLWGLIQRYYFYKPVDVTSVYAILLWGLCFIAVIGIYYHTGYIRILKKELKRG